MINTQDLKPLVYENSALYIFSRTSFNKFNSRLCANPILFETPTYESVDIDVNDDLLFANFIIKNNLIKKS